MLDGETVFATVNNLKCVGDAFPFKWQRGRDTQLSLDGLSYDEEEAWPASSQHAIAAVVDPRFIISSCSKQKTQIARKFRAE